MPSASLNTWRNDRIPRLAVIDAQCASIASAIPPNPHLIDENFRGFILLLSAHFQGFCRDLYTECAMIISAEVRVDLRALVQGQFTTNRKIDVGNPNLDNLKKDFGRFGFNLAMAGHDPANHARLAHLRALNEWRNIAAHQGTVPPAGLPSLATIQSWRNSCDGLAISLDDILYNRLLSLLHRRPWIP